MKTQNYLITFKTEQMKNFIETLDFLEKQQKENSLTTHQLHLIIQTMATFIHDENLKEIETAFNLFKN
jgi:hypothetical protein